MIESSHVGRKTPRVLIGMLLVLYMLLLGFGPTKDRVACQRAACSHPEHGSLRPLSASEGYSRV